jgi:hypothetical protein
MEAPSSILMLLVTFQKLGYREGELKQSNMSLIGFTGEPAEARGIISKELTVGSKAMPTTFFVVDVREGITCCWGEIGSMLMDLYRLLSTSA